VVVDGRVTGATVQAGSGSYRPAGGSWRSTPAWSPWRAPPIRCRRAGTAWAQHIAAAVVAPGGKRPFEEVNGDTLSTNVLGDVGSFNFG